MSRSIGISTFRESCNLLHQGEEPDTELSLLLYYATCWYGGRKEENCEWGEEEVGEIGHSSINDFIFYLCCAHISI